jgi:hypothetical protein
MPTPNMSMPPCGINALLPHTGQSCRSSPPSPGVGAKQEAADLRALTGQHQIVAVTALVDQGVTRASIASALGISSSSLDKKIARLPRARSQTPQPVPPTPAPAAAGHPGVGMTPAFTSPFVAPRTGVRTSTVPAPMFLGPDANDDFSALAADVE